MIAVLGAGTMVLLVVLAGSLLALWCRQPSFFLLCFGDALSFDAALEIATEEHSIHVRPDFDTCVP